MTPDRPAAERASPLERLLARQLSYGTWLASAITALGLLLSLWRPEGLGTSVITIGIGLFILLPVARVVLMLSVFLRERDYPFVALAAIVLTIIGLGLIIGPMH